MAELALIVQACVLGLIQGLAEFLPISSSAHLFIIPEVLGWPYLGKTFDVALHFGTLLALLVTFSDDVKGLLRGTLGIFRPSTLNNPEETRLAKLVVVGCIPVAILGLVFEKKIDQHFSSLYIMAAMLIIWGILLGIADGKESVQSRTLAELSTKDAFIIGCAQAAALMPGTSRSGSTITAALFLGISRTDAARFSFLLSLPVVAGACILKGIKFASLGQIPQLAGPVLVGILVSALSGAFCIKYFLKYLKQNSFRPFVVYRVILGLYLINWAWNH